MKLNRMVCKAPVDSLCSGGYLKLDVEADEADDGNSRGFVTTVASAFGRKMKFEVTIFFPPGVSRRAFLEDLARVAERLREEALA